MALADSAGLEVSLPVSLGGSAGGIDVNRINTNVARQTCQQSVSPSRGSDRGEMVKTHPRKRRSNQTDLASMFRDLDLSG